jgi:DNA-directed RNA polymerase specialized sigma54-like protein
MIINPRIFFEHVLNAVRPGGTIEYLEQEIYVYGSTPSRRSLFDFIQEIHDASKSRSLQLNIAQELVGHLNEAGFLEVAVKAIAFPLSEEANMKIVRRTFDAYAQGLLPPEASIRAIFAKEELRNDDFVNS